MSERKNIKRNKTRVTKDEFKKFGRKGTGVGTNRLIFPGEPYLQMLVNLGLL